MELCSVFRLNFLLDTKNTSKNYERILMKFFGGVDGSFRFWWQSGLVLGSRVLGSISGVDTEILNRFFDEIFGGVGHSPKSDRLDCDGYPDCNPNPGFLDLDHDRDAGILKDFLFSVAYSRE